MTLDEFFAALPKTGWRITHDFHLRHRSKDCNGELCCPLLAALPARLRREYSTWNTRGAASELDISGRDATRLIRAADATGEPRLRARLLAHCGLKERQ